jgi:hypothetical protein
MGKKCCDGHIHCLNCDVKTLNPRNGYCRKCWVLAGKGRQLKGAHYCVVQGCENKSDLGEFIGSLCSPCFVYLSEGAGVHSRAYRNERERMGKCLAAGLLRLLDSKDSGSIADSELSALLNG